MHVAGIPSKSSASGICCFKLEPLWPSIIIHYSADFWAELGRFDMVFNASLNTILASMYETMVLISASLKYWAQP